VFKKVLIANRGEIALRIIRACRELGLTTVAVYSEADRDAVHVRFADEDVCIGPPSPSQSYLDFKRIISAAEVTNAEAIHPGYGFLAENADFAEICESCGIVFIGPKAQHIRQMGDKAVAKDTMRKAGVPIIPGSDGIVASYEDARDIAEKIGYPVMLKAVAGGGGKGMRLCFDDAELERNFHVASTEAANAFSCPDLYLEKGIVQPHHVEIQIIGDHFGNYYHFGERDCSIQRRHQKLIEETPSPILNEDLRRRMGDAAIKGARSVNYLGVGTVEFLVDAKRDFYFMEMNTRIQVEHPVTEEAYEIDLLKDQLRVALGEEIKYSQADLKPKWAVIECRINAEDVDNDFRPMPGRIEAIHIPGGPGVRVDKAVYAGYFIPPYYDSMIAKLIVKGRTREEAIIKMRGCLDEFIVEGVPTTIPIHREIFVNPDFVAGNYSTAFIEQTMQWKRSSAAAKKKSVTFKRPGESAAAQETPAPVRETVTTDNNISK
jgi:acetyl-CoA carboxylase biotin carboxylase subunit